MADAFEIHAREPMLAVPVPLESLRMGVEARLAEFTRMARARLGLLPLNRRLKKAEKEMIEEFNELREELRQRLIDWLGQMTGAPEPALGTLSLYAMADIAPQLAPSLEHEDIPGVVETLIGDTLTLAAERVWTGLRGRTDARDELAEAAAAERGADDEEEEDGGAPVDPVVSYMVGNMEAYLLDRQAGEENDDNPA